MAPVMLLLGVAAPGCGHVARPQTSAYRSSQTPAAAQGRVGAEAGNYDDDADLSHNGYFDSDDDALRYYGRAAGPGDRRSIAEVVERYRSAEQAGDGRLACRLLDPSLARALAEGHAGARYLKGRDCATVMSELARGLVERAPGSAGPASVIEARTEGPSGVALLLTRSREVTQIAVRRDGGTWRIDALFDGVPP